MTEPRNELSPAGERRRERMLPLLQDAIRHRVRRRRQRQAIACSLLLLAATIGLVEVFERRSPGQGAPETMVADRGARTTPVETPLEDPLESLETSAPPPVVIRSFDPAAAFARALERDPGMIVTTPSELRADQRTPTAEVVVAYVTTDQLMMELSMQGMAGAVVCSVDRCRLRTVDTEFGSLDRNLEADDREL